MSPSYPSTMDREQFKKIQPILESARKKTRPRTVDLDDVMCGLSSVLKRDVHGECCLKNFPNGERVMMTLLFGMKKDRKREKLGLDKSKKYLLI